MARLNIRTRVILLSSVLLVVILGTNIYLTRKLANNSAVVAEVADLIGVIEAANGARVAFGELRYWMTDLAVSMLTLSERNAAEAQSRMERLLDQVAVRKSDRIAAVRAELAQFQKFAAAAVEEYTADRRVMGNSLLAQARQHSNVVDELLGSIVTEFTDEVAADRDRAVADVLAATRITQAIAVAVVISAALLTFFLLRSITLPLRRLVVAIDGLNAGNVAVPIPAAGRDEIGAMARTLAIFRDTLTERDRLTAEREHERKTLAAAIATISDGFVLYDADDRIVACNERVREIYPQRADLFKPGTSFREILEAAVTRSVADLSGRTPKAWIEERQRQHSEPFSVAELSYRNDLWVRVTQRRTHDGGTVMVYTDITELKRRQIELERAREEAEVANRTKSQFLANMSHELRTPLNAIIGLAEMLHEEAQEEPDHTFLEPVGRIVQAGKHLLTLINDILDLSKIEAGKLDLYLEEFDVGALVSEVVRTTQSIVNKNRNRLIVDCPVDIGAMQADQTRVRQVLLNLLGNACKFTEDGEIRLTAAREADGPAGWMVFVVADTGIGMTADQLGRLFQEFSQADSSTTRKYGGSGLGLAISQRLCRAMGGEITVASIHGRGAEFTVRLPDQAAHAAAQRAEVPRVAQSPTGRKMDPISRVLVIDDDPDALDVMRRFLGKEGFDVLTARGGQEGLKLARELRPSLITLDVLMPELDGWHVLKELKSIPELAAIPVIMLTIVDERSKGYALGAGEYITKPIDWTRLRAVLHHLSGGSSRKDILLIENEAQTRRLLASRLAAEGWRIIDAENGREGLKQLAQNRPSLILLDLMMPEMDGFEFLEALRGNAAFENIPVVVMTATDLSEADRQRLNNGIIEFVSKAGCTRDELLTRIRDFLEHKLPINERHRRAESHG
ncbi:adenylate cyclase [Bradyrhizobium sp. USDA 4524]|uniref:response regulator n=1 Tax=unclassified Bradyrhizobium TaxID=2631580 RepID=UPI00209D591F|nr:MULTISPECIES: response regulator [unclassified Bradyrhizobium]MCP1843679.1 signal transduction histidine kinase/DNA-binding response OmpR family regulator [Bradyrhizobium sp. USDA 4538]MCP1904245.1 signal transduction histidine kinase/DNA-binding response OmpR family regulator [Bradyrhizobium sp. USDA 4537]MCP1990099.1 signal transduction histidine kinase/DNA-binding response OmpR family regulator [Bradyrhizobium sp. USDA 4539]